jgi:hypothetical protein
VGNTASISIELPLILRLHYPSRYPAFIGKLKTHTRFVPSFLTPFLCTNCFFYLFLQNIRIQKTNNNNKKPLHNVEIKYLCVLPYFLLEVFPLQ